MSEVNYVYCVMREPNGDIRKIIGHNKPIDELKQKASEWKDEEGTTWEVIEDEKSKEFIDYLLPLTDVETGDSLRERIARLENVIDDVVRDLECAL